MTALDSRTSFRLPASSEVEDFTDQVDEACKLIAGLQSGSVSPDEFDRREAAKARTVAASASKERQDEAKAPVEDPERQQKLKAKIAELQSNQSRKQKARQRFHDHVSQHHNQRVTDYEKWELFTPEDEEDELIGSLTPNNPQMKAMEADIDARHARSGSLSSITASATQSKCA